MRPEGASLEGLAEALEDAKVVRELLLTTGSMFAWPTPKLTGLISFETLAQNSKSISILIDLWCPQASTAMTILAPQAREQAG